MSVQFPSAGGFYGSGFQLPPGNPVPTDWPTYTKTAVVSGLPVAIADVREFVGLPTGDTSRDTELTAFVMAATAAVEDYCQMSILDTTWQATRPYFGDRMQLAKRPFKAVTALEYVQTATGTITTVASTTYYAIPIAQRIGMIFLGATLSWPGDAATRHDAVRITFTAGFGANADAVPPEIKHAILMTVAAMDAKRGDCDDGGGSVYAMKNSTPSIIPAAAQPLLGPYIYRHLTVA